MTLLDLFFRPSGRVHRSGFVMMQVYSLMAFFVCLAVVTHWESLFLIEQGFDIWYVLRFGLAIIGIAVSLYVYVLSFFKRVRDLEWPRLAYLLCVISGANIVLAFLKGSDKKNKYGEAPGKLFPHHKRSRAGLWADVVIFLVLDIGVVLAFVLLFQLDHATKAVVIVAGLCLLVGVIAYFRHRFQKLDSLPDTPRVQQHFGLEVLMILIIVFFIRSFVVTPYQILGPSMDPSFDGGVPQNGTYSDGEFILVDKLSYVSFGFWEMGAPHRGDVVVFTPRVNPTKKYLIKRVIGLPGDKLKIADGYVWIKPGGEGEYIRLEESDYLAEINDGNTCLRYPGGSRTCTGADKSNSREYEVPEGKYFLMGDNRSQSLDSRQCFDSYQGCNVYREALFVPRSQIQGKVLLSLGHFDILDQVVPPKLGDLSWVIPPRWLNIPDSHDYAELSS